MLKKIPWSIIAGAAAIAVFYATAAVIVLYVVYSGIEGQTNGTASLFGNWYQTLLFIADIVFALVMAGASVMAVLKKKGKLDKREETEDETAQSV